MARQWEFLMRKPSDGATVMARYDNGVLIYAVLVVFSLAWMFIPA
jgi:hypothetical protein